MLLTVVLMAIVITLLFIMSGLVGQFNAEPQLATDVIGGGRNWVVPAGSGGPLTSPQPLARPAFPPIPDGESLLFAPSSLNGDRVFVTARDFQDASVAIDGRWPAGPGDIVVDVTSGLTVGDKGRLGGLPVSVVGTLDDATILAGVPLVFTTMEFGQQAAAAGQDIAVAVLTNDPNPQLPPEFKLLTADDIAADALLPLENAISSVTLVQALLWLITSIIVAAIVYITALERTRDFAVLKAVGGRTQELAGSLLVQGVIMTLVAVALAVGLQSILAPSFPMTVRVPGSAWWQIPVGASLVAVVAGLAGMFKVRATSPAEAFG